MRSITKALWSGIFPKGPVTSFLFSPSDEVIIRPVQHPKRLKETRQWMREKYGEGPFMVVKTNEVRTGDPETKRIDPLGVGQHVLVLIDSDRVEWFHSWWLLPKGDGPFTFVG